MYLTNPDGTVGSYRTPRSVHEAIGEGQKKRDYSNIRVPVPALLSFRARPLSNSGPRTLSRGMMRSVRLCWHTQVPQKPSSIAGYKTCRGV